MYNINSTIYWEVETLCKFHNNFLLSLSDSYHKCIFSLRNMSSSRLTVLIEDSITYLGERFGSSLSIQEEWIKVPRRAFSTLADNELIAIPRELNSMATLRFLGL